MKKLYSKMQAMSENDRSKAKDKLLAMKKEIDHLKEGDGRFKIFFDNVLGSMTEFGLKEMDRALAVAADQEYEDVYEPTLEEEADLDYEGFEHGERAKGLTKNRKKPQMP